ncbi:MAG: hypothetical protein ACTHLH_08530 [Solirubrobacterales bacterium]
METLIHVAESIGIAVAILALLALFLLPLDEPEAISAEELLPDQEAVIAAMQINDLAFAAERALFDAAVEARHAEEEGGK